MSFICKNRSKKYRTSFIHRFYGDRMNWFKILLILWKSTVRIWTNTRYWWKSNLSTIGNVNIPNHYLRNIKHTCVEEHSSGSTYSLISKILTDYIERDDGIQLVNTIRNGYDSWYQSITIIDNKSWALKIWIFFMVKQNNSNNAKYKEARENF